MRRGLKQRLIGALVILALVIIFLPMLLEGPVEQTRVDVPIQVPPEPSVASDDTLPPPDFTDEPTPGGGGDQPADTSADEPAELPEPSDSADGTGTASADDEQSPREAAEDGAGDGAGGADASEAADSTDDDTRSSTDQPPDGRPGSWVVQVGAFSETSNAESVRQRLVEAGFENAYTEPSRSGDETIHRVRVGPIASRSEAEDTAQRLEETVDMDGILVPR